MRQLFSWLHYLLLVPVLVALLIVSMLRLGLHGHPAYHQQVETWLQSVLQQPVAIEDFTLRLHGRDLAIDISGARLGHNDLALQRLSLSLDLKTLLLDQQLHLSQVQLFGLQVKFLESADGIWQAQGIRPLAQAVKSPSFSSPSPSTLLVLLQHAGSLALTDAQLTLVPQRGQNVTINNVSASINSLTADTVALNLQANYPATQGRLGAVAHIRFTEDLSILAAQAQVHLQHLPLQPIWQQLAVVQLANGHISGQAWVHLERQQLQKIHIRNLQLQTDYAGLPVDLQSDLDITRQADVWHMQVANIAGSIADHAWPVPDLAVVTNSRDWQLVSSKMQLAQVVPVLKQMAHL
ncbi:MAG: hypothetical protein QF872_06325, partial [Gammaproteobacteria bacterium]|nr:hypothetical protein [Gammaproteobacteria bacterium]